MTETEYDNPLDAWTYRVDDDGDWGSAAWAYAKYRLYRRLLDEEMPRLSYSQQQPDADWEAALEAERPLYEAAHTRTQGRYNDLWPSVEADVATALIEPPGRFWGTRSCWLAAAERAIDAVDISAPVATGR